MKRLQACLACLLTETELTVFFLHVPKSFDENKNNNCAHVFMYMYVAFICMCSVILMSMKTLSSKI